MFQFSSQTYPQWVSGIPAKNCETSGNIELQLPFVWDGRRQKIHFCDLQIYLDEVYLDWNFWADKDESFSKENYVLLFGVSFDARDSLPLHRSPVLSLQLLMSLEHKKSMLEKSLHMASAYLQGGRNFRMKHHYFAWPEIKEECSNYINFFLLWTNCVLF